MFSTFLIASTANGRILESVENIPEFKFLYMVDCNRNYKIELDETDSGVAFFYHFENWKGKHTITSDWFYQNGDIYSEHTFEYDEADINRYAKHWYGYDFSENECVLNVMRNNPENWKIDVYLDDNYLSTVYFTFEDISNSYVFPEELFVDSGSF